MNKEITLFKNNDNRDWEDLEWINEFYQFLKGEVPEGINLQNNPKLNPEKAMSIIWYLQEHFPLLPEYIEKCDLCDELFDTFSSGHYEESTGSHKCDDCI